jgi:nucleoside 2-deoxyribosyltransferase
MYAYIAGPLFNAGERWFDEQIDACARGVGLETFLPHRDGQELLPPGERSIEAIFRADLYGLDRADIVIANLNGTSIDDGTAWELGYAYAQGKHLVGIHTDMRTFIPGQVVNLMIECSLHKLARSLRELETYLRDYVRPQAE